MFVMARWTSDSCETPIKPATIQESFHRGANDRLKGPGLRLISLLVGIDVVIKVFVK